MQSKSEDFKIGNVVICVRDDNRIYVGEVFLVTAVGVTIINIYNPKMRMNWTVKMKNFKPFTVKRMGKYVPKG